MILQISTNLPLKNEPKMLYFPKYFEDLKFDVLIDTGVLSSTIPVANLRKIRLLVLNTISFEGRPREIQNMVANGQLDAPIVTVELQLGVGEFTFREVFLIMRNIPNALIGFPFLQRNSTRLDIGQGILNFPSFQCY